MTARRASAQPTSLATLWPVLAVAAAIGVTWSGFPGAAAAWLVLLLGAFIEQPPLLTGKKDKAGNSTPAGTGEARKLRRYQIWSIRRSALPLTLIAPLAVIAFHVLTTVSTFRAKTDEQAGKDWADWAKRVSDAYSGATSPPVHGDQIIAGFAAVAAFCATSDLLLRFVNAVCAASAVTALAWSRRAAAGNSYPGTEVTKEHIATVIGQRLSFVTSIALALLAGPVAFVVTLALAALTWPNITPPLVFSVAAGLAAIAGVGSVRLRRASLRSWRDTQEAAALWAPRWEIIKLDPAPACLDVATVGPASVYTFEAPATTGASGMIALAPKFAATLNPGTSAYVLPCPNIVGGQPVPGTGHPTRFRIVVWDDAALPDITDPTLPTDVLGLYVETVVAAVLDENAMARLTLIDTTPLHSPDSPTAVYRTTWGAPYLGQSIGTLRTYDKVELIGQRGGCDAIGDSNENLFIGAIFDPATTYADAAEDGSSATLAVLERVALETRSDREWTSALKQGANPPTLKVDACKTGEVGALTIHRDAFMTRVGLPPSNYFGVEKELAAAKVNIPFLAITGWPAQYPAREGQRHPQAFAVIWSEQSPPGSPDKLAPPGRQRRLGRDEREWPFEGSLDSPYVWVLTGHILKGFAAIKLAKPEVFRARCLTSVRSRAHIWQIEVALHDGVTVGDIRTRADRLRQALGVPWLRVADAGHGYVTIFVGAEPHTTVLADPDTDLPLLENLNWQAAWLAAKTSGKDGVLPVIEKVGVMPRNELVKVIDTTIPDGMSLESMRAAIPSLRVPTRYAFIDIRPGRDTGHAVILASVDNPIPRRQDYDFDLGASLPGLAFATRIDGEPAEWAPKEDPHILLAGVTGGGKTGAASALLYAARVAGFKVVLIDVTKGAADFGFMHDQCLTIARTYPEAAATMKAVYAEVRRRVDLATQFSVSSIDDLPETVRPPRWILFVDEFASAIAKSPVPPPSDDPDVIAEREAIIKANEAANVMGAFSGRFGREARSAGIHMVLAAQGLSAKALDSIPGGDTLKKNLARILLGKATWGDRMSALRVPDSAPMLDGDVPTGRAVWEPLKSEAGIVQFWYADQGQYAAELAARVGPETQALDVAAFMSRERPEDSVAAFGRLDDVYDPTEGLGGDAVEIDLGEMDLGDLELELDLDDEPESQVETAVPEPDPDDIWAEPDAEVDPWAEPDRPAVEPDDPWSVPEPADDPGLVW